MTGGVEILFRNLNHDSTTILVLKFMNTAVSNSVNLSRKYCCKGLSINGLTHYLGEVSGKTLRSKLLNASNSLSSAKVVSRSFDNFVVYDLMTTV